MLVSVNDSEPIVADRLLEILADRTPWHRGLWNLGLILTLREFIEASEAVSKGLFKPPALKKICSTCFQLLQREPNNSQDSTLSVLRARLPKRIEYDAFEYHAIRELTNQFESDYMLR